MSDVGLGANLELSITDALRRVDQLGAALAQVSDIRIDADVASVTPAIDAAVAAADRSLVITADASPLSASVSSAVDAADTDVLVTADAASVTGSIDGAVDAADSHILVTGDAQPVTSAVNGAIEAAQATAQVDVEGSVSPALQTDVLNLGANLADAKDEAGGLGTILGALSIGAAAKGLFELADAASEAEQSVGGVEAVFGEAANTIESFASRSAESAGLAATSARNLTAQIGGLLQGFDFTQEEAAKTSVVIAQLGADLAATFGGKPEEAVAALGGALRGEFNPLERFGVSLNIAQINAFALERGLAASTGELDLATRAQASLQIIMERTANAQGQFNREAETAAGVMAIARARAADLAAESGEHLTPALVDLVEVVSRDVLPKLAEAGDDVLPAVADAISNLSPLLGVTTDILVAMAPAVEVVADFLAAIPPEAVAIGSTMLIANKALGGLQSIVGGLGPALSLFPAILSGTAQAARTAAPGVGSLATGVTGLATSLASLNPYTVIGVIGAGALFTAWRSAGEESRRFAREVQELESSLETVDGRVQLTTGGITKYVRDLSQLSTQDQIDELNELGITIEQVARFAQRGPAGLTLFTDALIAAGDATQVYRNEFGELVTAQGRVIDANSELGRSLEDIGGRLLVGNTDIVASYQDVSAATEEVSKRQIALMQAEGLLTDEQVRTALAMNDSGDATRSYAEALNDLEPIVTANARVIAAAQAEYDAIAGSYVHAADAARALGEEAPAVNQAIADIASGAVEGDRGFLNLALSIDRAALSEEGFANAAQVLGVDVEALQGFVDSARDSIDQFVSSASAGLPTVSEVYGDIRSSLQASEDELARSQERDARTVSVSASQFAEGLRNKADDVQTFRENLAAITEAGFADVAALAAEQGQEVGGALAAQLVAALASGNVALLEELSTANETFQTETSATVDYMRDVLGPELILVSGLMGEGAAQALFEGIDFEERIRIKGQLAQHELTEQGQVIAVIAATKGADVAREFGASLNLDDQTIAAGVAAGEAIKANAPTGAARDAGVATGSAFGEGVSDGIQLWEQDAADKSAQLVLQARVAASRAAQEGSPSKLFRTLGESMGAGVVEGLDASATAVVAAAEAIVRDAAAAVGRVSPEVTADLAVLPVGVGAGAAGPAIPDSLIAALQAIAANGPAVSVSGATAEGAYATASETVRQLRAERFRQAGVIP